MKYLIFISLYDPRMCKTSLNQEEFLIREQEI